MYYQRYQCETGGYVDASGVRYAIIGSEEVSTPSAWMVCETEQAAADAFGLVYVPLSSAAMENSDN